LEGRYFPELAVDRVRGGKQRSQGLLAQYVILQIQSP
jgi:hypothetical protein